MRSALAVGAGIAGLATGLWLLAGSRLVRCLFGVETVAKTVPSPGYQ